jgi:hypothetical protein
MGKDQKAEMKNLFNFEIEESMSINVQLIRFGFIILIGFIVISAIFSTFGPEKNDDSGEKEDWVEYVRETSRIVSFVGFGMFGFGLLSLVFLSKKLHLYFRIAIILAIAIMIRSILFI